MRSARMPMTFGVFLAGFVSLVAQVLLLRELAVFLHGNELVFSAALAAWLLLAAMGSFVASCWADLITSPERAFAWLLGAAGLLVPLTLLYVRLAPRLFLEPTGAAVSFGRMFLITVLLLAPLLLVLGSLFALACRVVLPHGEGPRAGIGRAYILEAAGTTAGGLAFTFVFAPAVRPLTAALLLATAALAMMGAGLAKRRRFAVAVAVLMGAGLLLVLTVSGRSALELRSRALRLRGYVLQDSRDSVYGRVDVATRGGQVAFFENGSLVATNECEENAEPLAHLALLFHPMPRRVAMVGGALAGTLRKVLEHRPAEVDYCELDPLLVEFARRYASVPDRDALSGTGVRVHADLDARRFLRRAEGKYDVVLLDQPDPTTAAANRFFTLEFFHEGGRALASGGILAFQLSSAPGRLSEEQRLLTASILRTLKAALPEVLVIPCDDRNVFLASPTPGTLVTTAGTLLRRMEDRNLRVVRLQPEAIRLCLDSFQQERLFQQLREARHAAINRDDHPISYYYGTLLMHRIHSGRTRWLGWLEELNIRRVAAIALGLAAILAVLQRLLRWRGAAVSAALASVGFTGISLEVVLLLAFQGFFGYAYTYLGLLFAAFMLGLVVGSGIGLRLASRQDCTRRRLLAAVAALAAYAFLLPWVWRYVGAVSVPLRHAAEVLGFPLLTFVAGSLVGTVFPLSAQVWVVECSRSGKGCVGRVGGLLYACDLLGSFAGALLTGALLVPLLGLAGTCHAVAIFLSSALALLLVGE